VHRISFRRLYPRLLFPGTSQLEPAEEASLAAGSGKVDEAAGLTRAEAMLDSLAPVTWWRSAAAINAEAVVCHWWHPFFAPALGTVAALLGARGVPTVLVIHNLEPHERMPGGRLLARLALGRASGFVAQSERDAARLTVSYPRRPCAIVLPPPLVPPPCAHAGDRDRCARAIGLPPAVTRLLFFGYVRRYKGLPTLIEAMAELPAHVQLVVAGEIYHRDVEYYRGLAARAHADQRVVFLDRFLTSSEVSCVFSATDLVVLPYWAASQSAVAPLAMALGRAVVASAVGGIPDLVRDGETGALVPPRDPVALAAAIKRALESCEQWGSAAALQAKARGWDDAAAVVEQVVRRAMREKC